MAIKYLKWLEQEEGIAIRHVESKGGEKEICVAGRSYFVDGFVEPETPGGRGTIYEFLG